MIEDVVQRTNSEHSLSLVFARQYRKFNPETGTLDRVCMAGIWNIANQSIAVAFEEVVEGEDVRHHVLDEPSIGSSINASSRRLRLGRAGMITIRLEPSGESDGKLLGDVTFSCHAEEISEIMIAWLIETVVKLVGRKKRGISPSKSVLDNVQLLC